MSHDVEKSYKLVKCMTCLKVYILHASVQWISKLRTSAFKAHCFRQQVVNTFIYTKTVQAKFSQKKKKKIETNILNKITNKQRELVLFNTA